MNYGKRIFKNKRPTNILTPIVYEWSERYLNALI
jgi:hypothetical protein